MTDRLADAFEEPKEPKEPEKKLTITERAGEVMAANQRTYNTGLQLLADIKKMNEVTLNFVSEITKHC